jgi:hypothetical protein
MALEAREALMLRQAKTTTGSGILFKRAHALCFPLDFRHLNISMFWHLLFTSAWTVEPSNALKRIVRLNLFMPKISRSHSDGFCGLRDAIY